MWWKALIFQSSKVFLSWFGTGSFLGGDIASDFIFLFFLGMRFLGVTLDLVSPVNMELTYISVWSLSTTITCGADYSYLRINFNPLVTLCIMIDSLGNIIFPQIGATTFSLRFSRITWWCYTFNWIIDIKKVQLSRIKRYKKGFMWLHV